MGRFHESDAILEKSIQIQEQLGDFRGKGLALLYRGYNAIRTGNVQVGFNLLQDGSNLLQHYGGPLDRALAVGRLGNALTWVGKHDKASPLLRSGRELYRDLGALSEELYITILLGYSEVAFAPYGEIRRYLLNVLPIAEERKLYREKAMIFQLFGFLDSAEGPSDQTISYLEESTQLLKTVNSIDDLAWTTAIFALVYMRQQQYSDGKKKLLEALQIATEHKSMVPVLLSLPSSIILFIQRGRIDRAFTLYEVIRAHPTTGAQPRWWNDVCGQEINAAASILSEPTKEKLKTDAMAFAKNIPGLGKNLIEELESLN